MRCRIFLIAVLTSSLLAWNARADDGPARQTVRAALEVEPQFVLNAGPNGEPKRKNIDTAVAATPPAIRAAVKEWTGIGDRGLVIKVSGHHVPKKSIYLAMSSADTGSFRATVKRGEKVLEHAESHVRYKAALTASDEKTFSVLGILEFENIVTGRQCHVICHIEGEKPDLKDSKDGIIHPTGTATWTGPILDASTDLFADHDPAQKKR